MNMKYDVFLQSCYSNPKLNLARIAILKSEIIAYEEYGTGTKIFARETEQPVEITMSFDEVREALTKAVLFHESN